MRHELLAGGLLLALSLTALAAEVPLFAPVPGSQDAMPPVDAIGAEAVLVNAGTLSEQGPERIDVKAFGLELQLVRQRIDRRSATNWTWFGKVEGDQFGDAILLVDRGELVGGIHAKDVNWWVRPLRAGQALVCEMREEPFGDPYDAIDPPAYPVTLPPRTDAAPQTSTINILYLYTQLAENNAPTYWGTNILNVCQLATDYANQACINSSAAMSYANVGQVKYGSYTEIGDANAECMRVQTIPDGYFDDVLEQKDTYAADTAALVLGTPGSAAYGGFMSIVSQAFAPYAASAHPINAILSGVGEKVAHEVGHNLGLMHDWYVDQGTLPYTYAHGYYSVEGSFRCLMAYADGCPTCSRILYYSNPNITYNGYPLGIPEGGGPQPADCVRAIGNTAPVGATWRDYLDTCAYSLSEYSYTATYQAGNRSVVVNATNGCRWSAASDAAWLTITMPVDSVGDTHQGGGLCQFNYTENGGGSARVGHVTITPMNGGKPTLTYTLTQNAFSGNCTVSVNPTSMVFEAPGGGGSFALTVASQSCNWTATPTTAWITNVTPANGTGNATVNFQVQANATPLVRIGYIHVVAAAGDTNFTIMQNGTQSLCPVTLTPQSAAYSAAGGVGTFNVSSSGGCAYNASSQNPDWITVTGGSSGTGSGTVSYSVAANPFSYGRTGTVYVWTSDGYGNFTVTQNGAGQICNYTVGSVTTSYAAEGGGTVVNVTSTSGCAWSASSPVTWITFTPASGVGTAGTGMTVGGNTSSQARSAVVTIAGQNFTIQQAAYTQPTGPSITSVTSKKGKPGKPATIKGTGFSATKTQNTVKFGKFAATVTKATTAKLTVTIPTKCRSGRTYGVQVTVSGKKSNTVQFKVK